jgi:hypothetical protein
VLVDVSKAMKGVTTGLHALTKRASRKMGSEVRASAGIFLGMTQEHPSYDKVACRMPELAGVIERSGQLLATRGAALEAIIKARPQGDVSALVRGSEGRTAVDKFLASDHSGATLYVHRRLDVDAKKNPPTETTRGVDFVLAGHAPELHDELQSLAAPDLDKWLKYHEHPEGLPLREDMDRVFEQLPSLKKRASEPLVARIQGSAKTLSVPLLEWESKRDELTERVNDDGDRSALKGR